MRWYKPLYFSENLDSEKIQKKVLDKLVKNVWQPNLFVIVLCENGKDNFRIISSIELLQKNYPKADLMVIGIALGKDETFQLVEHIVADVYTKTGSVDKLKDYFQNRGGQK